MSCKIFVLSSLLSQVKLNKADEINSNITGNILLKVELKPHFNEFSSVIQS
jgi:hypothetical protein